MKNVFNFRMNYKHFDINDEVKSPIIDVMTGGGGGGGVATQKKPNATANFKFGTGFFRFFSVFFGFFRFFSVFFGFSILANFYWFNGFLLSGSCWL